jgi:hypothetical protein
VARLLHAAGYVGGGGFRVHQWSAILSGVVEDGNRNRSLARAQDEDGPEAKGAEVAEMFNLGGLG